jgi:hypothetical protein
MNRLSPERHFPILAALAEGNPIRNPFRMTGAAKGTVLSLLELAGAACRKHHDEAVRNLACKRIQSDEIWSLCYAKERHLAD